MKPAGKNGRQGALLPHRVAFYFLAAFLLGIVALLPFALTDVIEDIAQSANPTYEITSGEHELGVDHSHVNFGVTRLDEWQRTVTITVAGHRVCARTCGWSDRFLFVSIPVTAEDGEGLPPSVEITFPSTTMEISQQITLPVSGDPIRYPFDHYRLRLAVVMQRVSPDGAVQTVSPQEANGHLFLSVNGSIPRAVMGRPHNVPLNTVFVDDPMFQYVRVTQLSFSRPIYLQILTVLLILLVSAAAAYAVFLRPLNELVINSGALVLGVWGIRAILLGANVPGFTVIDLSLMVVILFLLAAITWRALWFLHDRGELHLPFFSHASGQLPEPSARADSTPSRPPDYVSGNHTVVQHVHRSERPEAERKEAS